jgi:hypothetical protein
LAEEKGNAAEGVETLGHAEAVRRSAVGALGEMERAAVRRNLAGQSKNRAENLSWKLLKRNDGLRLRRNKKIGIGNRDHAAVVI